MNDELAAIAGKYENLVGRLQERYGIAKEEANQQVKDFKKTIEQLRKSNSKLVRLYKKEEKRKLASTKTPVKKKSKSRVKV